MKIQQKVSTREVLFSSLGGGDTFRAVESDPDVIWMKTEYIKLGEEDVYCGLNAVDISDRTLEYFENTEKVIPVTINAVIEE